MQNILIDSHILIWLLYEPERFSPATKGYLERASLYISQASIWELALKHAKGKLAYTPANLIRGVEILGLKKLTITDAHILKYPGIKLPHKDPFDIMLVAQGEVEDMRLITSDQFILDSPYKTVDARI